MKNISITPDVNLDLDQLNSIIDSYAITRNALVNRFFLKIVNGKIDLKEFLDYGDCNESNFEILIKCIDDLKRSVNDISDDVNRHCDLEIYFEDLTNQVARNSKFVASNTGLIIELTVKTDKIKEDYDAKINDITTRLDILETSFNRLLDSLKNFSND